MKEWILSPVGYQKPQDTYDPEFFRMAVCTEALAFDVTRNKAAEMEIVFNCKPQRWSVEGQRTLILTEDTAVSFRLCCKAFNKSVRGIKRRHALHRR